MKKRELKKRCKSCQGFKPLSAYYKNCRKRDGVDIYCKHCVKSRARKYYVKHRAERLEAVKRYQAAHAPERHAYVLEWRGRNPTHSRDYQRRNRAIALEVYGGCCNWCGGVDRLELDHVFGDGAEHRLIEDASSMHLRIAKTGRRIDDWELQILCFGCHRTKTAMERKSNQRTKQQYRRAA